MVLDEIKSIKEEWKIIDEFPDYEISNLGNCRRKKDKKLLTKSKYSNGYIRYSLYRKGYLAHRLVAKAFVPNPNPEKYTIINHKDENKTNNIYTNLEWCDKRYNVYYGNCINKISRANSACRVFKYNEQGEIVEIFNNAAQTKNKSVICALSKRFNNRYFDGFYWFKEYEKFDIARRTNKIK